MRWLIVTTCLTFAAQAAVITPAAAQFHIPEAQQQADLPTRYAQATGQYQSLYNRAADLHRELVNTSGSISFEAKIWQDLVASLRDLNGYHRQVSGQNLLTGEFNYADPANREDFLQLMQQVITGRSNQAGRQRYTPVLADIGDPDWRSTLPRFDTALPQAEADRQEQDLEAAAQAALQYRHSQAAIDLQRKRDLYYQQEALTERYRVRHQEAVGLHKKLAALDEERPAFTRDPVTARYDQLLIEARNWHERQKAAGVNSGTTWQPMQTAFTQLNNYHTAQTQKNLFGVNFNFHSLYARERFLTAIKDEITHRDTARMKELGLDAASRDEAGIRRSLHISLRSLDGLYRRQSGQDAYQRTIDYDNADQRKQFLNAIAAYIEKREEYQTQLLAEIGGPAVLKDRLRFGRGKRVNPVTGDYI